MTELRTDTKGTQKGGDSLAQDEGGALPTGTAQSTGQRRERNTVRNQHQQRHRGEDGATSHKQNSVTATGSDAAGDSSRTTRWRKQEPG